MPLDPDDAFELLKDACADHGQDPLTASWEDVREARRLAEQAPEVVLPLVWRQMGLL